MGPKTPDIATVAPIRPARTAVFSGVLISVIKMMLSAYKPAPPIPWKARQTINCCRVCAKPAPMEKARKIVKAMSTAFLRPMVSLMRAKMTAKPRVVY